MYIGDKLKKIRIFKGWAQEEVAHKLNMSKQAYGKIERNETKVDMGRLEQLATVFGVSLDNLMQFDEKNLFFNNMQDCTDSITINNFSDASEAVSLLERIIAQQKDEIDFLRTQIERLTTRQ